METKFQTQTQSTCTSISQEDGFLTGARKFRLAAVVTIVLLMPLFVNLINQLLHMVSYDNSVNLFTNTLSSVGNAAFMFFIAPHVLRVSMQKFWALWQRFCSACCSLSTCLTAFGSFEA